MNIIINLICIIHGHHGGSLALCSSPLQLSITLDGAATCQKEYGDKSTHSLLQQGSYINHNHGDKFGCLNENDNDCQVGGIVLQELVNSFPQVQFIQEIQWPFVMILWKPKGANVIRQILVSFFKMFISFLYLWFVSVNLISFNS